MSKHKHEFKPKIIRETTEVPKNKRKDKKEEKEKREKEDNKKRGKKVHTHAHK